MFNLHYSNRSVGRLSLSFFIAFVVLWSNLAYSQKLDLDKLAAVQTVVNMYLLSAEDVTETDINVGAYSARSFSFNDEFEVSFPEHANNRSLEVCFVIRGSSIGTVQAFFNNQTTPLSLTSGENCFNLPAGAQIADNSLRLVSNNGNRVSISGISVETATQSNLRLASLTRSGWDDRAVRKVLKIFALGGQPHDSQIATWANMPPRLAIAQMLNFDEHNSRLSPILAGDNYTATARSHGSLTSYANYLASPSSNSPIPQESRAQFGIDGFAFPGTLARMMTTRGLNPFRQRIGHWETNYHLAVNLDASVSRPQMASYYDAIMEMHASGASYENVMGVAAKSAAVAMQYGHRRNECEFDRTINDYVCEVNEDFGREIHQLFYGIFGMTDPDHETVTIKETARMLTGMAVDYIPGLGFDTQVRFNTEDHHLSPLNILGRSISGRTADQKIDNLMPISINHPESLRNLPIMIISVLADDNLNEARSDQLRSAWAAMGSNKDFLRFIRAYAISGMFHGPEQVKYFTSFERAVYTANKLHLNNLESLLGGSFYFADSPVVAPGRSVTDIIRDDNAGGVFTPLHNVFGGQTSLQAADSAGAFEKNFNRSTESSYHTRVGASCDTCALGDPWEKPWSQVLPSRNGRFVAKDIARWLWRHAMGSLDQYSSLEEAHLLAILAAARHSPGEDHDQDFFFDLPLLVCVAKEYRRKEPNGSLALNNVLSGQVWFRNCYFGDEGPDYTQVEQDLLNEVYTGDDIENDPIIRTLVTNLGNRALPLTSSNTLLRERAAQRIQAAMGFIFATPFIFAEGEQ